jgi:hypothetical protein
MNEVLAQLCTVIEDELRIGLELLRNLESRKKAILAWDVACLMDQIQEKERGLRALDALEQQRSLLLARLAVGGSPAPTLRQVTEMIQEEGEANRLHALREHARQTFTRLTAEESYLAALMENISSHIHEALRPLINSSVPTYGKGGMAAPPRAAAGLMRGKG